MTRRSFVWTAAALMGIVATATIAWSASQLAGQHIALDSAPLSVSNGLTPTARVSSHVRTVVKRHRRPAPGPERHAAAAPQPVTAQTVPSYTPTAAATPAPVTSAPAQVGSIAQATQTTAAPITIPHSYTTTTSPSPTSTSTGASSGSSSNAGSGGKPEDNGGSHRDD